ncbi:hypothetical protein [Raineya orbicola]|jgi:hypothetical protein|uniref:DUF4890 domain-containing protein n=1 Tax=Raineya orbicola TaxID=2016530 RepID=A0A2N3IG91_9BACT|nr:hypothetical protein [Raineya orbicola]PKQ69336.1 hypothetical protein Rain11_1381 [Raineya orbicola]
MKKIFLLITLVLFLGVAKAQSQATAEQRATAITERMHKYANFTPEQKSQVYAINLDVAQRMIQVQNQVQAGSITKEQARQQRKNLNEERETRIVAILTPQQRAMYERKKQRRMNGGDNFEATTPRMIRGR